MAPSTVHLPNGTTLTVQPVFGGLFFKSNELSNPHSVFPPGWTIILNSEDDDIDHLPPSASMAAHTHSNHADNESEPPRSETPPPKRQHHIHRFRKPSLQNDHMFISSISNPSSSEFRPTSSPSRSIAMMLWATLWWYFHQPEPQPYITTAASAATPEEGRPKGEWRVNINREGVFKGRHLLPKLERMGLIASEDSSVGLDPEDGVANAGEGWTKMFVSRKSFWQLDPRIYLFTLTPTAANSPYPSLSPASSRPASPSRGGTSTPTHMQMTARGAEDGPVGALGAAPPHPLSRHNTPPGPYNSSSHLPTFYPPPPTQYTFTQGVRHPVRPKPPRQGETFYTRYIPSLGQYLSFRVASLNKNPCVHRGPTSTAPVPTDTRFSRAGVLGVSPATSNATIPTIANMSLDDRLQQHPENAEISDLELLNKWMNDPRVAYSWGEDGPISHQSQFLSSSLSSRHSFPAIGCFDGKPFGYFEIYWVREDKVSRLTGERAVGDWDRGLHCLVGEQEFRGNHRVKVWLSALVHWCWLTDLRTERVVMEPRVDNAKLRRYCEEVGFYKEGEVTFPHKQSNFMKIRREDWEGPEL